VQTEASSVSARAQQKGPSTAEEREKALLRAGHWLQGELKEPGIAAAIAGTALVIAAATAGVAEAALGGAGAYFVYRIVRRRRAKERA
jgi:hypothetical protein